MATTTGTIQLYFASKHSAQLMPIQATRLTDRYATIGGKRHPLNDEAGIRLYHTDKAEAYRVVLQQRLEDARKYARMLAEFDFAAEADPRDALENITYMVNMKNSLLRNWVLYGEMLKKEGVVV